MGHIVPHAGIMGIPAGCHAQTRRDADRGIGYAVGEADALTRNPIQIGRPYPAATATERIPTLLVSHQ